MRPQLPAALLLAALACGDPEATPVLVTAGPTEARIAPTGETIELVHRGTTALALQNDLIGIGVVNALDDGASYDPYWLEYSDALFQPTPPADLRFRSVVSTQVAADGAAAVVDQAYEGGASAKLKIEPEGDGRLRFSVTTTSEAQIVFVRITLHVDSDEAFYGLGEWPDSVEHRGKLRPMQMEPDLSSESANTENHVPIPLLLSTKGWGVFVESRRLGVFDVAKKASDKVEITYGVAGAAEEGLVFHLFTADRAIDLTRHYYAITGPLKLPARWAYGPMIWRDENRDQAELLSDVAMIRDLDLATSAIWIDHPYSTAVNSFDWKASQFPDPPAMIQAVHAAGLRLSLWSVPYLEPQAEPLRSEAMAQGYFVPMPGLALNGFSDPIDLTNPAAYAWWQGLIRRYTDMGIEGFKLDYAEDLLPGIGGARTPWGFFDGSDERTMHYGYTKLYHQVYAETLPADGYFLLCRAARWGSQVYGPVIWPGDLDADMSRYKERVDGHNSVGGVPTSLHFGLGLGPSGFPFYGADTGGYRHSPPDEETFIRWFQITALSSVMQVGDSSSQPPWMYTAENGRSQRTLDLYRIYARLHLRLFPYVWSYAERIAEDGRALMRPLGLAHPELGVHDSDTWLLGDSLLVAPVIDRGAVKRNVSFPAGRWYNWWTGEVIDAPGQTQEVDAPLETLPLYLAAGGIVPMLRDTIDTLSPATDPGVESFANDAGELSVRVAPPSGEPTQFTVFDGSTIRVVDDGAALRLEFTGGGSFARGVRFELYAPAPAAVSAGDGPVPQAASASELANMTTGWWHDGTLLIVKAPGSSVRVVVE